MAIIPNFFLDAVVALGVDGRDGDKHWIGTGFIVGRKENDNPTFSTYYIVRQTGRDRMIQEENSGLTIVHPVDRIKEVVELEWARIEKQNAAPKTVNPPALEAAEEEVAV